MTECKEHEQSEPQVVPEQPSKASVKNEKILLGQVTGWLRLRGYYYRNTSDILDIHLPPKGWQYHHNPKRTQGNPFLLDILLLGNDGRYLEFELKVAPIKYSGDEQRALCTQHKLPVFVTLEGVKAYVEEWEKCIRENQA